MQMGKKLAHMLSIIWCIVKNSSQRSHNEFPYMFICREMSLTKG